MLKVKGNKGFSLIELLLYLALAALLLLVVSTFLFLLLQNRLKNQAIAEVEQQGNFAVNLLTQTVRNATALNAPAAGSSGSTLSVNVVTASKSPTIFRVSNGVLQIVEGAALPVNLTSNAVVVTGLSFQNLSASGTKGTVRLTLTLNYFNNSNRSEYDYGKTFIASATLR